MQSADIEKLHDFWMVIWRFLTKYKFLLSAGQIHEAITRHRGPNIHPVWQRLHQAMESLVEIPLPVDSQMNSFPADIALISTNEFLRNQHFIEIPPYLMREFGEFQPVVHRGKPFMRLEYSAEQFIVAWKLCELFPEKRDRGPWSSTMKSRGQLICHLSFIAEQVRLHESGEKSVIADPREPHLFMVNGIKGPIAIAIRKHLETWRMIKVTSSSGLRATRVYVFV